MATTAQTTDDLNISQVIYFTANAEVDPPFVPVNAPNAPGNGILYGGSPSGAQTQVTIGGTAQNGSGYDGLNGTVQNTQIINDEEGGTGVGQGLRVTITVNAAGQVTAATAVDNSGTGYINTEDEFIILGNAPGAARAIYRVAGAAADQDAIDAAGKAAERDECFNLMPFNTDTEQGYSVVANGSNVVGIGSLTIVQESGTLVEDTAQVLEAVVVDSQAGAGTGALSFVWVANGAGLTNNAGTAVGGEANQRSFTPTEAGQMRVTCTATYATSGSGAVAQNSFTITS